MTELIQVNQAQENKNNVRYSNTKLKYNQEKVSKFSHLSSFFTGHVMPNTTKTKIVFVSHNIIYNFQQLTLFHFISFAITNIYSFISPLKINSNWNEILVQRERERERKPGKEISQNHIEQEKILENFQDNTNSIQF